MFLKLLLFQNNLQSTNINNDIFTFQKMQKTQQSCQEGVPGIIGLPRGRVMAERNRKNLGTLSQEAKKTGSGLT